MTPKDGTPWHDRVAARSLLQQLLPGVGRYDAPPPVRVPFLLVVPEADSIAPVPAALEVARKAPGAELFRSAGGHYDVYTEGGTQLRRRAANGGRLPAPPHQDRSPKAVLKALRTSSGERVWAC